jgi:hypothetical protein
MEQMFRPSWSGFRATTVQALSWPRSDAQILDLWPATYVQPNVVPVIIQEACASLARRAISAELTPDQGRLKEKVKVGPIETTYVAGSSSYPSYREVENMLSPFLLGMNSSGTVEVARS